MTIAACYLSTEGVVLGADSTTTVSIRQQEHHLNYGQKVFEIGDGGSLGVVMWGSVLPMERSYRTMFAHLADDLKIRPPRSVEDVANRWTRDFRNDMRAGFGDVIKRTRDLSAKNPRTPEEQRELEILNDMLSGGFCIGGYVLPDRSPAAFEVRFSPHDEPPPQPVQRGTPAFWGMPRLIERLVYGCDGGLLDDILQSGKWSGTNDELFELIRRRVLTAPATLPLRDAVDWVYSSIYTTIKAMKFSHWSPVCGGPIEIAVISTDRPFRWVRHKSLGEAIDAGTL